MVNIVKITMYCFVSSFLLSLSHTGDILCSVGRDRKGKMAVILWDLSHVEQKGEVFVLTKAFTDISIERMRIAGFNSTR